MLGFELPDINRVWVNDSGSLYLILMFTNLVSVRPDFPPTVVYRRLNDGSVWSRPVANWKQSMTPMHIGVTVKDLPPPGPAALIKYPRIEDVNALVVGQFYFLQDIWHPSDITVAQYKQKNHPSEWKYFMSDMWTFEGNNQGMLHWNIHGPITEIQEVIGNTKN